MKRAASKNMYQNTKPDLRSPRRRSGWKGRCRSIRTFARGLAQARLALLFVVLFALAGCGYSHQSLFPTQYQTVAVPIFQNRTFYRGVEFDLTEALIKQIETRTPYKVTDASTADTILTGTITRITQHQLSRSIEGGVPEEMEMLIRIDFTWKDQRTGAIIRERRGFEDAGRYVPTRPVSQPYEIAQHTAVAQLAQDVVSTMRGDW